MRNKRLAMRIATLGTLVVLVTVQFASAAVRIDTSELRDAVTVDGVRQHQAAFQAIADENGGEC